MEVIQLKVTILDYSIASKYLESSILFEGYIDDKYYFRAMISYCHNCIDYPAKFDIIIERGEIRDWFVLDLTSDTEEITLDDDTLTIVTNNDELINFVRKL